ncbi:energy transducer TonB [Ventosimonas gracilis]|uniref:Energy transducer TonB n=1 Tax=Ventosimonas gracilis TaxID=1680762 RepID=A0A139SXK9_9GAMM|nr:energy transducer TonB [Ventosimonas gracilis]KXU39335.1 energy transducer TonB [Ventosimonas gracilis]
MSAPVRSFLRYGASLLAVLLLHGGLAIWAFFWQVEATPAATPPATIMLELPPLPEPVIAPPPPPPPPEPEEEPEPEVPEPEIVIEKPKPKPKPPKPPQPKPPEPPPPPAPPAPPRESPPPVVSAPPAPQVVATRGPSEAEVSWQTRLLSHLARYKRYPEDARRRGFEGTVKVRFKVDAGGKLLSAEVVGPSASASLDRATLTMLRRAGTLPKPPAELIKGDGVEVIAPFVYSLERRR